LREALEEAKEPPSRDPAAARTEEQRNWTPKRFEMPQ